MKEFPHLCTACSAEYPGPAELADHLVKVHAPLAKEPDLELERRLGGYASELALVQGELQRDGSAFPEYRRIEDTLLVELRADAASAVASKDRERMLELVVELGAIAKMGERLVVELRRRVRLALQTSTLLEHVLDLLEERDP